MAKGQDTRFHPNRRVSRDVHMENIRNENSFVGTFHGTDNGRGYFSAESTGGGATDSRSIPWVGGAHSKGQMFAMIPASSKRGPLAPGHNAGEDELSDWRAYPYNPETHGHLPGAPKK